MFNNQAASSLYYLLLPQGQRSKQHVGDVVYERAFNNQKSKMKFN